MLISPGRINAEVIAPASKSESIRALLIGLLNPYSTKIYNISDCDDATSALNIVLKNRAIKIVGSEVIINESNKPLHINEIVNCGESALLVRFFAAFTILSGQNITIIGKKTINQRNFNDIVSFCDENQIFIEHNNFKLPITIKGKHKAPIIAIDASETSQLLSGFLIANAFMPNPKKVYATDLVSKGYATLTLSMLNTIGLRYSLESKYYVLKPSLNLKSDIVVSGDWSGAAFLLVAGATSGCINVKDLDLTSSQPDRAIFDILTNIGAELQVADNKLICKKSKLRSFVFDAVDNPDLIPPLVTLALTCNGISQIKGINRLINKESNRLIALFEMYKQVGAKIEISDDTFIIEGGIITGGNASSFNDHRIAMSLAVSALNSINGIEIDNVDCVSKSFPNFFSIF